MDDSKLEKVTPEADMLQNVGHQSQIKNQEISPFNRDRNVVNKIKCCGRCGSLKHISDDRDCPAKETKCYCCGKIGHFRQYCSSRLLRKRNIYRMNKQDEECSAKLFREKKEVDDIATDEVDYVYNLNNDTNIICEVGGVRIKMVIDSGAKYNIIGDITWNAMKDIGTFSLNQEKPDITMCSYASKTPLKIIGSFETTIKANCKQKRAEFYIVVGGRNNLLGKETAVLLGVLNLGLGIHLIQNDLCFNCCLLLGGNRLAIPYKFRQKLLDAVHEGHPGIVRMKERLRCMLWWPGIDKDTERMVKSCKGCTSVELPNPSIPMERRELPESPWIDVAIDLLGPLPSNDYIFVVVDYYSRYKEVKIISTTTSIQLIKLLKETFSRLGYPTSVTADNERQFVGEELKTFCKEYNISLFSTGPYCPQQNGEVDLQNRDILKRLKIANTENKNLEESLWEYLRIYNSTPHSTRGKTPMEMFFRRQDRAKDTSEDRTNIQIPILPVFSNKEDDSEVSDSDEEANVGNITVNEETEQSLRENIIHLKKVEGVWKSVHSERSG